MNKKRNILVGTASVAVAVLAIGGGASASSRAMAGGPTVQKATLTIVQMDGGEAVTCTFDDVDLPVPAGVQAAATAARGVQVAGSQGVIVSVRGDATKPADGEVPPPPGGDFAPTIAVAQGSGSVTMIRGGGQGPEGPLPVGVNVIGGTGDLMAPDGTFSTEISPTADGTRVFSIAAMASASDPSVILQGVDGPVINGKAPRQGTPDECSAMRKDLPPLPAVTASTQVG